MAGSLKALILPEKMLDGANDDQEKLQLDSSLILQLKYKQKSNTKLTAFCIMKLNYCAAYYWFKGLAIRVKH